MPAAPPQRIPNNFPNDLRNDDPRQRLIVALDVSTAAEAQKIVAAVGDSALTYKVGMMLRAAVDAAQANPGLMVLAVTVLTSLDANDLVKIGVRGSIEDSVVRLATIALANGCQGIVTSAREASTLRAELGQDFAIVTPGVRPAGTSVGDQVRVVTPAEAIASGASHIVVGRPITEAADPAAEARAILGQIGG